MTTEYDATTDMLEATHAIVDVYHRVCGRIDVDAFEDIQQKLMNMRTRIHRVTEWPIGTRVIATDVMECGNGKVPVGTPGTVINNRHEFLLKFDNGVTIVPFGTLYIKKVVSDD